MGVCVYRGQLLLDAREMFKILRYMRKHWAGICSENKTLSGLSRAVHIVDAWSILMYEGIVSVCFNACHAAVDR